MTGPTEKQYPDAPYSENGSSASESQFEEDVFSDFEDDEGGWFVDIVGYEGPLDLLLSLAREQKVDLTKISILELAQQYLDFIFKARQLQLEIAADYLVMAAWLAYLKSCLLLPKEVDEEENPDAAMMAAMLAHRLKRLDAMREAGAKLMSRNRLGRDIFARGEPEGVRLVTSTQYQAEVFDLLNAYARERERTMVQTVKMKPRRVWSIRDARKRLERMIGVKIDWQPVMAVLNKMFGDIGKSSEDVRSLKASTFTATLEMAREGHIELKQSEAFAPIFVRQVKPV